jgi:hypothetical protein
VPNRRPSRLVLHTRREALDELIEYRRRRVRGKKKLIGYWPKRQHPQEIVVLMCEDKESTPVGEFGNGWLIDAR